MSIKSLGISALEGGPRMGLSQYLVVFLCMLLNMMDGFDLFIVGFALPHLPNGFASASEKGFIISAALFGMGIGAMFLARLADRVGRRITVLGGLLANLIGLVVSALAVNAAILMTGRFLTGLGVGVVSVVIVVIAQEASPAERRSMSTGIVMIGFPLGSTVGAFASAAALSLTGNAWQSLFWAGVILAVIGLAVAYFTVPESAAFLARAARAVPGGETGTESAKAPEERPTAEETRPALFGRSLWATTLLLAIGYGMLSAAYYFVGTWTPQLITNLTGDQAAGAIAGISVSVGTLVGAVLFALVSLRFKAVGLTTAFLCIGILAIIGFALLMPSPIANIFGGLLGLTVFASMAGYTAMVPTQYPVLARAKGYGMMLGIGRVGAIIAPLLVGFAVSVIDTRVIYFLAIIPVGFAVAFSLILQLRSRKTITA
ncbi:MFS transporter [Arthrobacter bambusae]|uniref:MFS transporter n=1 Tax=Arthrobacter bambusae TaxID=1338426 RepID=UPI001F50F670|nr:MFS transporter [Arthrobacter bambusae]MCI0142612.1 MFS transporter [Arthrobacter bambusae]